MLSNGVLTVTGNGANDVVRVVENGNHVTVMSGHHIQNFQGVQSLVINLGGGNDRLNLDVSGSTNQARNVSVQTGTGNDRAVINLHDLQSAGAINLNVDLGAGNDQLNLRADELADQTTLNVNLNAGAGNDRIDLDLEKIGQGSTVNATLNLGAGNDVLQARLKGENEHENEAEDENQTGGANINLMVDGGAGNDTAHFNVDDATGLNVQVSNVEHVFGLNHHEHEHEHEHEHDD